MKKITITILIICAGFSSSRLNAQNLFTGGSFTLNPGLGYGYDYGYLGTFYPAIGISGDYGLKVNAGPGTIGIGGIVGFKFGYYDYTYNNYTANYSETVLALRGTYHWTPPGAPKLDLYGGIPVGIRFDHYSEWNNHITGYDINGNPIYSYYQVSATATYPFLGLFIGAAYYFNNRVGIFGELGYDVSIFTIGISFKLK
jgi:hypothetical protein